MLTVILRPNKISTDEGLATGVVIMTVECISASAYLVALKIKMKTHPYPFALQTFATIG